jgi:hypothetical protein
MKKVLLTLIIGLTLTSCAELLQIITKTGTTGNVSPSPVTTEENIAGLKSSLDFGIEKAVNLLGIENGFYGNALLKLMLPPEAQPVIDNIKLIPGGQELVDKAILAINRSAEDAVKEAIPIFKTAIKNMTFSDVMNILFGAENAATEYLRSNTLPQLTSAFAPKVKESLAKPLVANVSTNETWNLLSNGYNSIASSPIGMIAGLKTFNVSLEEYVTQKALEALFIKVAEQEKAIRTNPVERVTALLQRVFGQLDKK